MRILKGEEGIKIDKEMGIVVANMISTESRDHTMARNSIMERIRGTKMVRNRSMRRETIITRATKAEAEGVTNREEGIKVKEEGQEGREGREEGTIETDRLENMNKMRIMKWMKKERHLRKRTSTKRRKYLKRSMERMKNGLR